MWNTVDLYHTSQSVLSYAYARLVGDGNKLQSLCSSDVPLCIHVLGSADSPIRASVLFVLRTVREKIRRVT